MLSANAHSSRKSVVHELVLLLKKVMRDQLHKHTGPDPGGGGTLAPP